MRFKIPPKKLALFFLGICVVWWLYPKQHPIDHIKAYAMLTNMDHDVSNIHGNKTFCSLYYPYIAKLDAYYSQCNKIIQPYLKESSYESRVINGIRLTTIFPGPLKSKIVRNTVKAETELIESLKEYRSSLLEYITSLDRAIDGHIVILRVLTKKFKGPMPIDLPKITPRNREEELNILLKEAEVRQDLLKGKE